MFKSKCKEILNRISAKFFSRKRRKQEVERILKRLQAAVEHKKELYEVHYDQRNTILIHVGMGEAEKTLTEKDFRYIEKKFKKFLLARWVELSYSKEERFITIKVSFIF